MVYQTSDGASLKAGLVVKDLQSQLRSWQDGECQRVSGLLLGLHVQNAQATVFFLKIALTLERIVFKGEQAFKERGAAWHLTAALHLHKRAVFVLPQLCLLLLELEQPGLQGFMPCYTYPQG